MPSKAHGLMNKAAMAMDGGKMHGEDKAEEAKESPEFEAGEAEGEKELLPDLCPACHAKVLKHLIQK